MISIALVEDERDLSKLVKKYLENEGYAVDLYYNGEDAIANINNNYSLWILDIMLEGELNGYDLIKMIRQDNPKVPVVFSSARDQSIDKIMGLELGCDDYIAKPYSPRELLLRVKNLIKRLYGEKDDFISYNEYKINFDKRSIFYRNECISLTTKEFDLLSFLISNKGQAFSRNQILNSVWGSDYFGNDRVVDDLMRRIRQKLPLLNIETIYGFGYRLL